MRSIVEWLTRGVVVRVVLLVACVIAIGMGVEDGVAFAAAPHAAWSISTVAAPTVAQAGTHYAAYVVIIENTGGAASEGEVTVTDRLPAGFSLETGPEGRHGIVAHAGPVGGSSTSVVCNETSASEGVCGVSGPVPSGGAIELSIWGTQTASVGDVLRNVVSVSGGGAIGMTTKETTTQTGVQGEQRAGGISSFAFSATNPAGESDAQAGGHPSLLSSSLFLNSMIINDNNGELRPVEPTKDVVFYLPLGFVADAQLAARCEIRRIGFETSECPSASRVGTIMPVALSNPEFNIPVYNVAPERGYAAEYAFNVDGIPFFIYGNVVRRDGRYVVRVSVPGVSPAALFVGSVTSFFGDLHEENLGFSRDLGAQLTDPSVCSTEPLDAEVEVRTWHQPDVPLTQSAVGYPSLEGCGLLRFSATLGVHPDSTRADEPSGYGVDLEAPQAPIAFTGLGTPPVKALTVSLPTGTTLSPAGANGLGACQEAGPEGIDIEGGESEAVAEDGLPRPVAGHCPASSRIATVHASSPDLGEELSGHMFLATPRCGGQGQPACTPADAQDGNLFGVYLELEAPSAGVLVKLPGKALVDPTTGQVTTVFENLPQFPVGGMRVETTGGPRAPLANAQTCGAAGSNSDLTPWSTPVTPGATASSVFGVDWDGQGGACPGVLPFNPGFNAGTVVPAAGGFSPFTLTLTRQDREQDLAGVSVSMPPGVAGILKGVPLCGEPQASQGACPAGSRVGTVHVAAGAGSQPLWQEGPVYLTTGYKGQPFGLSIAVPAVAGPFNLGTIVVRAGIHVDPTTAAITVSSDPLPQMIDGVPLRVKTVNVTIDRSGFIFNPTSCSQLHVTGAITGSQGTTTSPSTPFAVTGCTGLPFKPSFKVSTQAKTSKSLGASLDVKYVPGTGSNTARVAVTLPRQLPARLTTIQQACTEAAFAANPGSCPAASDIGTATATTPILQSPLSGPVYLVSHGGAAFPDVVAILQGEGITVQLTGNINIKKGITSSTFASVPDAPITSFAMTLPEGPHSGLASALPASAKGSFCGKTLSMPTMITAQNGMTVKQNTKIAVTGCPKAKTKKKKARGRARKPGAHRRGGGRRR